MQILKEGKRYYSKCSQCNAISKANRSEVQFKSTLEDDPEIPLISGHCAECESINETFYEGGSPEAVMILNRIHKKES